MADISVTFFGPIDTIVGPYIEYILLVLAVANLGTRKLANDYHRAQAEDGADAISRHPVHQVTTWALVLGSLYYMTLHHHGGMVMSTLVLGLFITDFFEFEARKVEAREGEPLELPKAALGASSLVVLYIAYQTLFFIIEPVWKLIV